MTPTCLLSLEDGRFLLTASPRLKDLIKTIPGFSYDYRADRWHARPAWAVAVAARGVLGDNLDVTPEVSAWAMAHRERLALAEAVRSGAVPLPLLPAGLRDFQVVGASYLVLLERTLLADEMGTGKTVQSAAALQVLAELSGSLWEARPTPLPALVICTSSMKGKWVEELHKWTGLRAVAVGDTKPQREKAMKAVAAGEADVLVCHWDAIALHSRLAPYGSIALTEEQKAPGLLNELGFATVIADESHKAKDPKAQRTRALWAIGDTATYRWALTGTPIAGQADDLWSILRFIAPHEFPSKSRFLTRYALTGQNAFGGFETYGFDPRHEAELQAIIRPYIIRRTKAEVLPELPPKVYDTRPVVMGAKQAKAYKTMKAQGMFVDDGELVLLSKTSLTTNGRLNQLASATPVLEEVDVRHPETGEMVRVPHVVALDMPSCKVDALLDLIAEAGDEPIVVGAESRKLLELCSRQLTKKKIGHALITGAQSSGERTMAVDNFQAGGVQVVLVSLGAGAEGITLTRARRLVLLQASYSAVVNDQFEDRIHRFGQEADSVDIVYVITKGTVDEDRPEAAAGKRAVAQQVLRDEERLSA